jgi:hypothetical protein
MYNSILALILIFLSGAALAQAAPSTLRQDLTSGPWSDTVDEDARGYAYTVQDEFVFQGPTALRFELRHGDCYTAYPNNPAQGWDDCTRDRERAEVRERWSAPVDTSMWYSIMVYIPSDYQSMYPKQIFWQWLNDTWGPNMFFHLSNNRFYVDILTEKWQTTTQYALDSNALPLGQWNEIVVNVVWSGRDDLGRMDLYVAGQHLISHKGATLDTATYTSGVGPHVKYGIYRSHLFRYNIAGLRPTHVLYFDEYRRGYSFADVDVDRYAGD